MKAARPLACLVSLAIAGCLEPASVTCGDGLVCPPSSRCDAANHRCVTSPEEIACSGLAEGGSCTLSGAPGACRGGACLVHFCGDGMRSESEACEGTDLGGTTCQSLGFYGQTTGLECSADCTFDTTGCSGICGDGVINGPEVCDGAPPFADTCAKHGYDRGFLACTSLCSLDLSGCEHIGWQVELPQGAGQEFAGVWGSSSNDVYAVGGAIVHWDGAAWSIVGSEVTNEFLWDVLGSGPNDVWVNGHSTVLHWDGKTWSQLDADLAAHVTAFWTSGPNDAYVARDSGTFKHWDGTTWSDVPNFPVQQVSSLWGTGPHDVYAAPGNDSGIGSVLHWDGSVWEPIFIAADFAADNIWGTGPSDVYASRAVGPSSLTYHWDGKTWGLTSRVPFGCSGSSGVLAFSQLPTSGNVTLTHDDDSAQVEVGNGYTLACWADSVADTVLVGLGIWEPGRGTWVQVSQHPTGAMWGMGDDVFVASVDALGHFAKDQPVVWYPVQLSGPPLAVLRGTSLGEPLGILQGEVVLWSGSVWVPVGEVRPNSFKDVGGSGPDDLWAVGTDSRHWNGQTWSPTPVTGDAIWVRTADDAYVVGPFGVIEHWDGTQWSVMKTPTTVNLHGVWGNGADVFVVGDNVVLHLAANDEWQTVGTIEAQLRIVSLSGRGNLFVGDGTDLYHFRAGAWEPVAPPAGIFSLGAFWVTPDSVYWGGTDSSGNEAIYRLFEKGVDCWAPEQDCTDGWDNDCDGLQDADDPDCVGKTAPEQCSNLADDDGDGLVDCMDPDCAAFPGCSGRR